MRRQMAQLLVGRLEALRTCRDHLLEILDLVAHDALVLPLASQCVRALYDLDGLEWLFYHQQFVGVVQTSHDVGPIVIGMSRTYDDLDVGVDSP